METRTLTPNVTFGTIYEGEGTVFCVTNNKDGRILYKTVCPVSIAFVYADYWTYCTVFKCMDLPDIRALTKDENFLFMNIEDSLSYLDTWEFLSLLLDWEISHTLHLGKEYRKMPRTSDMLKLYGVEEIHMFIDEVCKSKTMIEIIYKMLSFIGKITTTKIVCN